MNTFTLFQLDFQSVKKAVEHLDIASDLDFHSGFFIGSTDSTVTEKMEKFIEYACSGKINEMKELTEIGDVYSLLVKNKHKLNSYRLFVMMYPSDRLGLQKCLFSKQLNNLKVFTNEALKDRDDAVSDDLTKVRWCEVFKQFLTHL